MSKGFLNIDLLGTTFAIQADESDEYLAKLYAHFTDMVDQVRCSSSVSDPIRLAIIAGILVTDELYKEQYKNENSCVDSIDNEGVEENLKIQLATRKMIEQIDAVLSKNNDENLG